jgi:hypothetical protein
MYLFISFLVFLVLFSIPSGESTFVPASSSDSSAHTTDGVRVIQETRRRDSTEQQVDSGITRISISTERGFVSSRDTSIEAYLKGQQALPKDQRDNAIRRYILKKFILVNEYGRKHPDSFGREIKSSFRHSIPQMFFISIPIFAFLLYLLYIRRRQAFYYVSHGIFSIHFYCAAYVFFLVFSLIGWAAGRVNIFQALAVLVTLFYLYKAMRKFYKQRRAKTVFKFLLLTLVMSFFLSVLWTLFFVNSLLKVPTAH